MMLPIFLYRPRRNSNNEMELILVGENCIICGGKLRTREQFPMPEINWINAFNHRPCWVTIVAATFPAAMPSTIIIYDFPMRHKHWIKSQASARRTEMNVFIIIFFAFGSNAKHREQRKTSIQFFRSGWKTRENSETTFFVVVKLKALMNIKETENAKIIL